MRQKDQYDPKLLVILKNRVVYYGIDVLRRIRSSSSMSHWKIRHPDFVNFRHLITTVIVINRKVLDVEDFINFLMLNKLLTLKRSNPCEHLWLEYTTDIQEVGHINRKRGSKFSSLEVIFKHYPIMINPSSPFSLSDMLAHARECALTDAWWMERWMEVKKGTCYFCAEKRRKLADYYLSLQRHPKTCYCIACTKSD